MASLRKRVDQHCKECIYDPKAPGTWRQQVALCSVILCALHDVRPKSTSRPSVQSITSAFGAKSEHSQRSKKD